MFNMGFGELVLLAVIGLLVLGPEQLPGVARKVAKLINEFKRATDEVLKPAEDAKRNFADYLNRPVQDEPPKEDTNDQPLAKNAVDPDIADPKKGHHNE